MICNHFWPVPNHEVLLGPRYDITNYVYRGINVTGLKQTGVVSELMIMNLKGTSIFIW